MHAPGQFVVPRATRPCSIRWTVAAAVAALLVVSPPCGATIRMSEQQVWHASFLYATGVGWADFDSNGWLDLAVAQGLEIRNYPNALHFNQGGQLAISPGWTSTDQRTSAGLFIGDLDNDGYPDMAVASLGLLSAQMAPESHVVYYSGGGPGLNPTPGWLSPPGNAFSCTGGDTDGDGDIDLLFAEGHWRDGGLKKSTLFMNDGGVFGALPAWETNELHYGCDAAFGDVDRDGDLDLAMGWGDSTGIALYMNLGGTLETTPSWTASTVSGGLQMDFGDMDGDGFLDLAVADLCRGVFVFKNTAGVLDTTPCWSFRTYGNISAVAWADLDGDGDQDLATAAWYDPCRIFENANGMLAEQASWSYNRSVGAQQIAFADFDEDSLFTTRETFNSDGRGLFYVSRAPIHELLTVELNGAAVPPTDYCCDPQYGWFSVGAPISPGDSVAITYVYSLDLDMAITEWSFTRVFENQTIHPPYVVPDLCVLPATGHAPLHVQFSDLSESNPAATAWAWDFDSDGIIDSREQHPEWTYALPGSYDVSLVVDNGAMSETVMREACVKVFDGESALCFRGSSGGVQCDASLSLTLSDAATIEAWICPEGWGEVQNAGAGRIVDKTNIAVYLNGTGNAYAPHSLILLLRNANGPPRVCCTPESSIVLGEWHHVAATYSSTTGQVCMYINGVERPVTFSSLPSGPIRDNANETLYIGNGSAQNYTFDGVIDEVRVWTTARSGVEIAGAMGHYLEGNEAGLAGYWRMNEGNGSAVEDWTAHGNDGALMEGTWVFGSPFVPSADGDPCHPTPDQFALTLSPGYPNPTPDRTTFRYMVPDARDVRIEIFDIEGRLVKTLTSGLHTGGTYSATWDGADAHGRGVAPGIYFAHMAAGSFSTSRPCVLLR